MSSTSKDELHEFEQKMRENGSDGFADGPRPWEHWDESGNQASTRVWEGSARRIRKRGKHGLGHRLLSLLAFIALATLLVGIGGVYFTHMQTQQVAQTGVQPLPISAREHSESPAPQPHRTARQDTAESVEDLNVLTAPAAGRDISSKQPPVMTASDTVSDDGSMTIEPASGETITAAAAIDPGPEVTAADSGTTRTAPPVTDNNIDSVSIETVVTEQSVTTTVYTRNPQQADPEVIAAIETTPPPFAREVAPEPATEPEEPVVGSSVTPAKTGDETLEPSPAPDTAITDAANDTAAVPVETQDSLTLTTPEPVETTGDAASIEPKAEAAPKETKTAAPPAEALPAETATADSPADEPAGLVMADTQPEPAVVETAAAAPDTLEPSPAIAKQPIMPVAKTGDWVINLASYTWKSTASKKLAGFQERGVDGEVFEVMIKDKPMYRIRVTGFASSRDAKAGIPAIEEALGLEGAWVSRR